MSQSSYSIPDEPKPTAWSKAIVNPMWPLFAFMFINTGVAWLWLIINGIVLGSPTQKQEWLWIGAGVLSIFGFAIGLPIALNHELITERFIKYALLILLFIKLGISYRVYTLQNRSYPLYEYFHGPVTNGSVLLIILFFLWNQLRLGDAIPGYLYVLIR